MRQVGWRSAGWLVVLALTASACASGSDSATPRASSSSADSSTDPTVTAGDSLPALFDGGVVSDAALDAVLGTDGQPNPEALDAFAAEFAALELEQREPALADLSLRTELDLAAVSGLQEAVGGRDATAAALTGAYAQVRSQVDSAAEAEAKPAGFRRTAAVSPPSAGTVASVGLIMGYIALSTMGSVGLDASNTLEAGDSRVTDNPGLVMAGSVDELNAELTYMGTQDGVDVQFDAATAIHPCPEADGRFTIDAVIEVKASKGGAGQNAKIELTIDGTVDDNADLASQKIESRTQWSDFGGGKGQFVDFTSSGPNGAGTMSFNRTGGTVTDDFVRSSTMLSTLVAVVLGSQLISAAEKAWKSGRCVTLKTTPSAGPKGLTPSQVVEVLAEPRSKVDGTPTGGMVTATLSAGGASVEPNGSPVPADANSTYTAEAEQDKTGTVAYESRSKRGVGTASITFSTSKPAAYVIVGGLQDWQVNQVVCDVTQPFMLTSPGVGTAQFSGGLTGTYSATGVFNFSYSGTYSITLSDGLGSPGSMIGTSSGQIHGEAGSGSENYTLTPTTC